MITQPGRPGFVEMVRRANAPPAPEHSITFRLATLVTVLAGIVACASVGELSAPAAVAASVAVAGGMLFSYVTRTHPWGWVKVALAVAVLAVFIVFVFNVFSAARTGELTSIEVPLAALFTWVQVVHAFDVPARRDLLFSVAAGAALVTVAAAQAVSAGFLVYVAVWLVASIVALACSWRSMTGSTARLPAGALVGATVVVVILAVVFEALLPPPRASQTITLPNSVTSRLPLPSGGLTQGGANPTEPARAGSAAGPTRIGGFVGFAGPLDTGIRGQLSNEIVLRVRADRPGYFLGQTYNTWNGQSWYEKAGSCKADTVATGSPFDVSSPADNGAGPGTVPPYAPGSSNIQTFYVEQTLPNLLFGTSVPEEVYFPDHSLVLGCDQSIRSTIAMTAGTVYTVISDDDEAPLSALLDDRGDEAAWSQSPELQQYLQLPQRYPRAEALARSVVRRAHAVTIGAIVQALETWIGAHTQYTTDIPPLLPGQDAVNQFLFVTRKGYCEQISTALTVMLRTLGIPAREATGYVPGSLNPLSDLYEIRASDAHAWVQVYTGPRYGWQNFDPTTYVPLSPVSPGTVLLHDIGHELASLPWAPIGGLAGFLCVVGAVLWVIRRRRLLPPTPAGRLVDRLERCGRRAGISRDPADTLGEYADRLAVRLSGQPGAEAALRRLEGTLGRSAYAGHELSHLELASLGTSLDEVEEALAKGALQRWRLVIARRVRSVAAALLGVMKRPESPPPPQTERGVRPASGAS